MTLSLKDLCCGKIFPLARFPFFLSFSLSGLNKNYSPLYFSLYKESSTSFNSGPQSKKNPTNPILLLSPPDSHYPIFSKSLSLFYSLFSSLPLTFKSLLFLSLSNPFLKPFLFKPLYSTFLLLSLFLPHFPTLNSISKSSLLPSTPLTLFLSLKLKLNFDFNFDFNSFIMGYLLFLFLFNFITTLKPLFLNSFETNSRYLFLALKTLNLATTLLIFVAF